jgi:hypothetical protein
MKSSTLKTTQPQLTILKILYTFRFASSDHIAQYRKLSKRATYESLMILIRKELILRRYPRSYRLLGKPARYLLSPKGLKLLRTELDLEESVTHPRYKDRYLSEAFVDHTIAVNEIVLALRRDYEDRYTIQTKYDIFEQDSFIHPLQDLYLSPIKKGTEYFIESVDDLLFFIIKKRLRQYIDHCQSLEWDGDTYPTIIFLTNDGKLQKKIQACIEELIEDGYYDDDEMHCMACSTEDLKKVLTKK